MTGWAISAAGRLLGRASLVLLLVPALLWNAPVFALSVEEETKLGEEFLASVRRHFEILEDDFADQYINELGQQFVGQLETARFPFHFYLIKSPTLNAFAAPGGHVFLFSGLVEALDDVDQLAAVVSHEVAHVAAKHLAQRIEQNKKIGLVTLAGALAGALIGGEAAEVLITGSLAAGIQAQLHYSREDERQADLLGLRYMASAGYDRGAMIGTLRKLEAARWLRSDQIPAYLQTHPGGPERMANLDALLAATAGPAAPQPETGRLRSRHPYFKALVRATCLDPGAAEQLFSAQLKTQPNSPVVHFGLGVWHKERMDYPPAAHHLRLALEKAPGLPFILVQLGEVHRLSGQSREAIGFLEQALSADPNENPTALFNLALAYASLEQHGRAVQFLERVLAAKPARKEIHYHLGVSYGRQDKLALAHFHFGLHFKALGEGGKARFHFDKAESLAGADAGLQRRIREARERRP